MAISPAGLVSMVLIFLAVLPLCVVEGRIRLLQDNMHEESGVDTHVMPSGVAQPLSGRGTDPGNNIGTVRKLSERRIAMEALGKSASSDDDEGEASMVSVPAPPPPPPPSPSARRRFMPFHTQFVSKFPWFSFAKDSDTVSPSPGTPSPGHN